MTENDRKPAGGSREPRGPRPARRESYPSDRGPARPSREGGPPRSGGFSRGPRTEGGPPRSGGFSRGPRTEGGPPRSGGFSRGPRTEGGPPRSGGFSRGPRTEGGPPRSGGFSRGPRTEGGPPRSGGFSRGPRTEGGPPRSGGFSRGPRTEGGPPRSGGFSRGPRTEGGPPRSGGFSRGPRTEGGPPRSGGFSRGPRTEGGPPRSGGFSRGPRTEGGPPRSGGFSRGPRTEGGPPRSGGFSRGPRTEGGPPRSGGFSRGPRTEGGPPRRDYESPAGAVNRSRPAYEPGSRVRWRRDGTPSPATAPKWKRGPEGEAGPSERPAPLVDTSTALPADPREAALRILHAVDTRGAFSDRLLDGAHARGGDPRDRALLHELVKGALRWRGRLDHALDARIHIGLPSVQPWIRNILRLGAYQVLMLDRIPAHAAVDESVKLAHKYGHPGAAGLVNSVLRRLTEEKETITWPAGDDVPSLAAWGSHPEWIVERWLARFGIEDTRALLLANNRPVPTGLRVNRLRGTREELIAKLAAEGVEARAAELSQDLAWVEGHHSPGLLKAFREGWCTAQDESESLVGRIVAPEQHERLLDLCAAPGGKSTHLAELIGDEGEVWAMEKDSHRVASLEAAIARLGLHAIHVVHGDGRTYSFPMPFDRILVDAPCSGLGVLGRRADARWRKGPDVLVEMPPVQLELLASAAHRLRPGGLLVYSVCTFEPEETDQVVAAFLAAHPGFQVESVAGLVPDAVVTSEGYMRTLPQKHGCDGAFAVRFRKA